ncbi:hypothetical protein EOM81_01750 [bacterium]|nr:hypothetical protein [bacterium]
MNYQLEDYKLLAASKEVVQFVDYLHSQTERSADRIWAGIQTITDHLEVPADELHNLIRTLQPFNILDVRKILDRRLFYRLNYNGLCFWDWLQENKRRQLEFITLEELGWYKIVRDNCVEYSKTIDNKDYVIVFYQEDGEWGYDACGIDAGEVYPETIYPLFFNTKLSQACLNKTKELAIK